MDITGNPSKEAVSQILPALPYLDYFLPSSYEAMALSGKERLRRRRAISTKKACRWWR